MAEIPVERRRAGGRGPLLIVLALVVVAAGAWFVLGRGGSEPQAPVPPLDSVPAAAETTAVPPAEAHTDVPVTTPAAPAAAPPAIVGDDTTGRIPEDTAPAAGDTRLGTP